MTIHVDRYDVTPTRVIGRMLIDGLLACYTLEDPIRDGAKVTGETAIPAGTYSVIITPSAHFGRLLPLLQDVPGFTGVRLHGGNSVADTAGCLLLGMKRSVDTISDCLPALTQVQASIAHALASGESVTLTIQ